MALFNSREKNGKENSVEKVLHESFPSNTIADVLKKATRFTTLSWYPEDAVLIFASDIKNSIITLFHENNKTISASELDVFVSKTLNDAKKAYKGIDNQEVRILYFETSIVRSLNKKLGINIEFPIITYLRDLCLEYHNRLKKDLPTEVDEDAMGSEPMFAPKRIIPEPRKNDRSYVALTKNKYSLINGIIKRFLPINMGSPAVPAASEQSQDWFGENSLISPYTINRSPSTDQDKILRDFEQDMIKAHATFSKTRDPWYREFAKQLFSLGFINLYRHVCKGNLTHGDKFFDQSKVVLMPKNDSFSNLDVLLEEDRASNFMPAT